MKDKQAAVVLLILVIIGLAYGADQMRKRANEMRSEAEAAKVAADNAETQRLVAEASLRNIKAETDELREFYRSWLPHLEAVQNAQAGEAKVIETIKRGGVFSTSQQFADGTGMADSVIPKTLKAQLVFEDEYSKAMNWMGEMERLLPTARTSEYEVRRGDSGNDVHISLVLEVPIFDPKAMVIRAGDAASAAPAAPTPEFE